MILNIYYIKIKLNIKLFINYGKINEIQLVNNKKCFVYSWYKGKVF